MSKINSSELPYAIVAGKRVPAINREYPPYSPRRNFVGVPVWFRGSDVEEAAGFSYELLKWMLEDYVGLTKRCLIEAVTTSELDVGGFCYRTVMFTVGHCQRTHVLVSLAGPAFVPIACTARSGTVTNPGSARLFSYRGRVCVRTSKRIYVVDPAWDRAWEVAPGPVAVLEIAEAHVAKSASLDFAIDETTETIVAVEIGQHSKVEVSRYGDVLAAGEGGWALERLFGSETLRVFETVWACSLELDGYGRVFVSAGTSLVVLSPDFELLASTGSVLRVCAEGAELSFLRCRPGTFEGRDYFEKMEIVPARVEPAKNRRKRRLKAPKKTALDAFD